jgi:hypothetical protein
MLQAATCEGYDNVFAEWGYNRYKKSGNKQIVAGLLCDEEGKPVSIELFKGSARVFYYFQKKFFISDVLFNPRLRKFFTGFSFHAIRIGKSCEHLQHFSETILILALSLLASSSVSPTYYYHTPKPALARRGPVLTQGGVASSLPL